MSDAVLTSANSGRNVQRTLLSMWRRRELLSGTAKTASPGFAPVRVVLPKREPKAPAGSPGFIEIDLARSVVRVVGVVQGAVLREVLAAAR
jgi:hypothetical protein